MSETAEVRGDPGAHHGSLLRTERSIEWRREAAHFVMILISPVFRSLYRAQQSSRSSKSTCPSTRSPAPVRWPSTCDGRTEPLSMTRKAFYFQTQSAEAPASLQRICATTEAGAGSTNKAKH